MKIGVCSGVGNSSLLKKLGYDYLELGLSSITALSEEAFDNLHNQVLISELKPYAFNVLFPADIKLTGEKVDNALISTYLTKALTRASILGGEIVVFGSGGSRKVPEGFSYEKALSQLTDFLKLAGDIAASSNLTIVIEPLRFQETNIINTASEGLKLARKVNHPNIKLLIDFYHMTVEGESADIILEAGAEYLKHVHVANPSGRVWPVSVSEADYQPFFDNLRNIGYDSGISIEGSTTDIFRDAPLSINCLKRLIEA